MANNDDYHGLEMYKNHAKDPHPPTPALSLLTQALSEAVLPYIHLSISSYSIHST